MTPFDETGSLSAPLVGASGRSQVDLSVGTMASGLAHIPGLATSGTRSTGSEEPRSPSSGKSSSSVPAIAPKVSQRHRVMFNAVLANVDRAIDTATDPVLKENALGQARDGLNDLWGERTTREEQFAQAVNIFQNILAGRGITCFSLEQLALLRTAIARCRDEVSIDDDSLTEMTLELLQGGIDVFRELD
jgi:hypothetical protein